MKLYLAIAANALIAKPGKPPVTEPALHWAVRAARAIARRLAARAMAGLQNEAGRRPKDAPNP